MNHRSESNLFLCIFWSSFVLEPPWTWLIIHPQSPIPSWWLLTGIGRKAIFSHISKMNNTAILCRERDSVQFDKHFWATCNYTQEKTENWTESLRLAPCPIEDFQRREFSRNMIFFFPGSFTNKSKSFENAKYPVMVLEDTQCDYSSYLHASLQGRSCWLKYNRKKPFHF